MVEIFLGIAVVLCGLVAGFCLAFIFAWSSADRKNKMRGLIGFVVFLLYAHHWIILALKEFKVFIVLSNFMDFFYLVFSKVLVYKVYNLHGLVMQKPYLDYFWYPIANLKNVKEFFFYNLFGAVSVGFIFFAVFAIFFLIRQGIKPKDVLEVELQRYNKNVKKTLSDKKFQQLLEKCKKRTKSFVTVLGYTVDSKKLWQISRFFRLKPAERSRHIQVLGSTGSGKTASVIFPMIKQDIQDGNPVIFVDAKGDLKTAKILKKLAIEAGREKDFMMFHMSHPEKSNTYNPLYLGNAAQLKDKIIGSMDFTEPHYKRECETALQVFFMDYFEKFKYDNPITIGKLAEYLKHPPTMMNNYCKFLDTHEKNIQGIQNEMKLFASTEFSHLFETPSSGDIDLLEAVHFRKIIYFALNPLMYSGTAERLGKLITGDINTLCGLLQTEEHRPYTGIYIDEYKLFGTTPFSNTFAQGRSAGFMLTIAHQANADLKAISEEHPEHIKANTLTKIILPGVDASTAEEFSKEVGTYKDFSHSRKVAFEKHNELKEVKGVLEGNKQVSDFYKIHPQEIKELEVGFAYFKSGKKSGLIQIQELKRDISNIVLEDKVRSKSVLKELKQSKVIEKENSSEIEKINEVNENEKNSNNQDKKNLNSIL